MCRSWFQDQGVKPHLRPLATSSDALAQDVRAGIADLSLPQLLRYEDQNSMHHSIESRVPFCNHKLAEYAASLPPHLLISENGILKHVFRESVRHTVPPQILNRPKLGFDATDAAWLRASPDWVNARFRYAREAPVGCLAVDAAAHFVKATISGARRWNSASWRILNVLAWAERFAIDLS